MKRAWWLVLVVGCAVNRKESSPPPVAPAGSSAPTTTVDEDGTGTEGTTKTPAPTPMPGSGASGAVVMSPEIAKAQAQFDQSNQAFMAAGNDCAQLCKALSSMTNATDHLCELTGEDKRCTDAKARLDAARAKVKSTCGVCS